MIQRPLRWFCAVAGVAALLVADLPAQIVPHPYDILSIGNRTLERFISDGMVHRANIEFRTLRSEVERSSAIDNLPFDRAEIDRGYGHAASADRSMREFAADRPNSPLVPFAVTQRALAAI
ncbi:MAG: hypothetical protein EHM43_10225, partial [Ignavibacteriae bacterium]